MASPRPSTAEMQSLFVEFGLPMEPKSYDEAVADESCQIIMGYYEDPDLEIIRPIDDEIDELPYYVDERTARPDFEHEGKEPSAVVWIESFFTDGLDFAYYIIGGRYVKSFTMGTFNSPAYSGPMIAAPVKDYNSELLPKMRTKHGANGLIRRSHGHMERVKWKYFFETARVAWNTLLINPDKVRSLRAQNARILQDMSRPEDVEVRSVTSTEAREVEGEMSAKKKGKMRLVEVEEPISPIVAAHILTSSSDPERQAPSPPTSNVVDEIREAQLQRITGLYDMMKNMNATDESIKNHLQDLLEVLWSGLRFNRVIQRELEIWTSEFRAAIRLDRQLDKDKQDPLNTDQTHTWETDERLELERDELFASVIDFMEERMVVQESKQLPKQYDHQDAREVALDQMINLYDMLKDQNAGGEAIKQGLKELLEPWMEEEEENENLDNELEDWIPKFLAAISADRILDDSKKDPRNTDGGHILKTQEKLREDLFDSVVDYATYHLESPEAKQVPERRPKATGAID